MTRYDVFNGDADGICALLQLRLAVPADSTLVTGAKRDIKLLERVDARAGDVVTVLDLSADVNGTALRALLERGVEVHYFDHHFAGELPPHPHLHADIDPSGETCTSLIVDEHLRGAHRIWAVVGAYGDDLAGPARACAAPLGLRDDQLGELRELGELLAYNAYGDCQADLILPPAQVYRRLRDCPDPFAFVRGATGRLLAKQRRLDLGMAALAEPQVALQGAMIYVLADAPWARRVRGVFANELAHRYANLAHAVLTPNAAGGYTVSVRAPQAFPTGADEVCRRFATGGGRVAAAGINHLPRDELPQLAVALDAAFQRPGPPPR